MRAVLLVIDSFGIGSMPDAAAYGDEGANTALHICGRMEAVRWPNLTAMGLGNAAGLLGGAHPLLPAVAAPRADFGVLREKSPGKDTTTGHWELAGIVLEQPFHLFPPGPPSFPRELLRDFGLAFNCGFLGNRAASGTEIIAELGEEHLATGNLIVYTSADSVFQIAAHEDRVDLDTLYAMCAFVRNWCDEQGLAVGRVIARPFAGEPGAFRRTPYRKDFSMRPPRPHLLGRLEEAGIATFGVGKIPDIFADDGISNPWPDKGNPACLERTLQLVSHPDLPDDALIFVNLVDTDMVYGHRRDPQGYHDAVAAIDATLPAIRAALRPGDVLALSADHGCDPTWPGSDHTREHVPVLWEEVAREEPGRNLGIRQSFADLAQSLCAKFGVPPLPTGLAF